MIEVHNSHTRWVWADAITSQPISDKMFSTRQIWLDEEFASLHSGHAHSHSIQNLKKKKPSKSYLTCGISWQSIKGIFFFGYLNSLTYFVIIPSNSTIGFMHIYSFDFTSKSSHETTIFATYFDDINLFM